MPPTVDDGGERLPVESSPGTGAGRIAKPVEVGCFARRGDEVTWGEAARGQLRRYREPCPPLDLNEGFASFVPKRRGVTNLLPEQAFERFGGSAYDVVTYRNNLNKICGTPYNNNEPWEIGVRRCRDGRLDLSVRSSQAQQQVDAQTYYGYAFEAACCGDPLAGIDANDEFVVCIRLKVGRHMLFVAAEVDCIDDHHNYVELKTHRLLEARHHAKSFERFKLLKCWIQSYLAGVPTIVFGFKDESGGVQKLQTFRTTDLPSFTTAWSPQTALGFLERTLDFLRTSLAEDAGDDADFRLAYDPAARLLVLEPL
ncbi:hypothetical protein CTAYLR_006967 [Chrysophaeum taylorii]|uniref:Decapping nuclease n=1 Tax=Chrysophaeum taylorii TaxID=2483200 RepID=A0AAD7XIT3_9STRA|nr:hypothetical protein CTAYLR_006967 [Chrysophaeum taylorii]